MGDYKGIGLAEKLKIKADAHHSTQDLIDHNNLRDLMIQGAEKAAAEGDYEYTIYDDKLIDTKLLAGLKRSFKSDGFKVEGGIDDPYSEHVGKDMYYIRVSWK